MRSVDDGSPGFPADTRDQWRHDLKTALTTISGRAQLLARAIRRSPSLTEQERDKMLQDLATIEAAVRVMVARIDVIGSDKGTPPL
jgi:hypothetical protein